MNYYWDYLAAEIPVKSRTPAEALTAWYNALGALNWQFCYKDGNIVVFRRRKVLP